MKTLLLSAALLVSVSLSAQEKKPLAEILIGME